ncbi:MAG: late competence development ComFB family protein [Pseudohongiella sp.]|nr:late competence development ComFB family protein [Pseudohongiella sp.]
MEGISKDYESLVFFCIQKKLKDRPEARDEEYIADVACVALNRLPARYIRHIVDTRFFESEDDIVKSDIAVDNATSFAIEFINSRRGQRPDGAPLPGTRMDSI